MKKLLIHITMSLVVSIDLYAQKVDARFDTTAIRLGEQFQLSLYAKSESGDKITFPELNDTIITEIEILDVSEVDTNTTDSGKYLTQSYKLTSFDSGYYAIPPFKFVINNDTQETRALLIHVKDVPVDTTQAIKDIKTIEEAPPAPSSLLWLWITLAILALAGALYYFLSKRKKEVVVNQKPEPQIPAHILALKALDALKEKKLWQSDKFKEYHSELTDIIRTYIENRFGIPALEQTSDEVLMSISRSGLVDSTLNEKLKQTLKLADMAKFAKAKPIASENELSLANAYEFVNQTKQEDQI